MSHSPSERRSPRETKTELSPPHTLRSARRRINFPRRMESSKSSKTLSSNTERKVPKIKRCSARCRKVARRAERQLLRPRGGRRGRKLSLLLLRVQKGRRERRAYGSRSGSLFRLSRISTCCVTVPLHLRRAQTLDPSWNVYQLLFYGSVHSLNSFSKLSFACFAYSSCETPRFLPSNTSTENVPLKPVLRTAFVTFATGK